MSQVRRSPPGSQNAAQVDAAERPDFARRAGSQDPRHYHYENTRRLHMRRGPSSARPDGAGLPRDGGSVLGPRDERGVRFANCCFVAGARSCASAIALPRAVASSATVRRDLLSSSARARRPLRVAALGRPASARSVQRIAARTARLLLGLPSPPLEALCRCIGFPLATLLPRSRKLSSTRRRSACHSTRERVDSSSSQLTSRARHGAHLPIDLAVTRALLRMARVPDALPRAHGRLERERLSIKPDSTVSSASRCRAAASVLASVSQAQFLFASAERARAQFGASPFCSRQMARSRASTHSFRVRQTPQGGLHFFRDLPLPSKLQKVEAVVFGCGRLRLWRRLVPAASGNRPLGTSPIATADSPIRSLREKRIVYSPRESRNSMH